MMILSLETVVDGNRDIQFVAIGDHGDGGKLLGRVCLGFGNTGKQSAWLYQLFVAEEYRRRGIGKALVDECIREARRLGEMVIALSIPDARNNEKLIEYYGSFGFGITFCHDDGGVTMSKIL